MTTPHLRRRAAAALVAVAILGVTATACGEGDDRAAPAAASVPAVTDAPADAAPVRTTRVRVSAGEYFFRAPSRVSPGPTTFVLRNAGRETHQLAIARLAPGVSAERAIAMRGENGTAVPLGEVVARPGVTAELFADLRPGRHVMLCFEGEDAGQAHFVRGQRRTFVVG